MRKSILTRTVKTLTFLVILSTITVATVQVISPVEETLEPNETLDLTEVDSYGLPVNIEIQIGKENWEKVESKDLDTSIIEEDDEKLTIFLGNTSNEEGTYNSTITFIDEEGETQENTIKYNLVEKSLSVDMVYP
ncbi:MAG: hypothetical protein ACOCTT_02830, partial [archaeon]